MEVCNAPNVLAHAFFRESIKSGEYLPEWAGHRMARESGGACDHPYAVRLVEWDGRPADVTLKLPGPVAMAAKTNLLGEVPAQGGWLTVEHPVEPLNNIPETVDEEHQDFLLSRYSSRAFFTPAEILIFEGQI